MIGRPLGAPRCYIDPTRFDAAAEGVRAQNQVDAQTEVSPERAHAVIPPREGSLRLLEQPERVVQSEVEDPTERGALGGRAVDLALPRGGVVYVAVVRRDVEVADEHEPVVTVELAGDVRPQRFEPRQLVHVLVR